MGAMRIGELAGRSGIGIETIRYYEREGLLEEPEREPSGYRQYEESALARLRFIRRAKEVGFTLGEIKELLGLWFDPDAKAADVHERTERKIADIEEKICSLEKMKQSLRKILDQCDQRGSVRKCPLLAGLAGEYGQAPE